MALPIPHLSYEGLRAEANALLRAYNPSGLIPVPIEQIVEFRFGINIVPIPGLQAVHEVDAFTSKDLRTIMVDLSALESRSPYRYRFSLAHELAHVVLHREVFAEIYFSTLDEWKRIVMSLPEPDREWLEWQAYNFAGLVLVPGEDLRRRLDQAIEKAAEAGFNLGESPDVSRAYVCTWLGRQFEVSAQVIDKRLDKDGLWPPSGESG